MTEIRTLSEFIEWASQFKERQYLFRGVPNDTFEIEASAYRRLPEADRNNPSELLRINKELINEARTLGHDLRNGRQLSDLELLAELQHFGAATCLIDFSRSALNVLWFACQKTPKREEGEANGKVFAVPCDAVSRLRTVTPQLIKENIDYFFKQDENERYLYQWTPKLQNNRIIAQHSVFLFGGAQIEVAEECVIMQSSKPEILKSLAEVSDITEATMYPDFDGFARLHVHDKPYVKPDAQGLIESGVEAHKRDNLSDAIDYYDRAIERDPNDAIAHLNRGFAYDSKQEYDKAIEDFTMAIELKPNNPIAYLNRGFAYDHKGEYDKASRDFTKVIELDPDNPIAYLNRGFAYNGTEEYDKASRDFNKAIEESTKAIEREPNNAEAYFNRGMAYKSKGDACQDKGNYNLAIADFNKAVELRPDFVGAYNHRGVAYRDKGEYDYAIKDFNKAIEIKPDDAEVYYNRGLAHYQKSDQALTTVDFTEAIADFTEAIKNNPHFVHEVHYNRGRAWLHQKDWKEAESDLQMASERKDIIALFHCDYGSVSAFEQKYRVKLPPGITALLIRPQA